MQTPVSNTLTPCRRALIVNCYADETRRHVARRLKVPGTLDPVFLAGGLNPRKWQIRLYDEVFDGPLENEGLLSWSDDIAVGRVVAGARKTPHAVSASPV